MTTPDFEGFLPYSIQGATHDVSIALIIKDPAQQNDPNAETHRLRQGTYIVQLTYDGPGVCRLMCDIGGRWVERTRVPAGDEFRPRTAVANLTVLAGETMALKMWGDQKAGYAASLTVTSMPNYKK